MAGRGGQDGTNRQPDDCPQSTALDRRECGVNAKRPSARAVNGGRRRVVSRANPRRRAGRGLVTEGQKKQVDRNGTLDPVHNQGNLVNCSCWPRAGRGFPVLLAHSGGGEPCVPGWGGAQGSHPSSSLAVTALVSLIVFALRNPVGGAPCFLCASGGPAHLPIPLHCRLPSSLRRSFLAPSLPQSSRRRALLPLRLRGRYTRRLPSSLGRSFLAPSLLSPVGGAPPSARPFGARCGRRLGRPRPARWPRPRRARCRASTAAR